MEKFEGFKVGQEFEILNRDDTGIRLLDGNAVISTILEDGDAFCTQDYLYGPEWVDLGYIKLIKDVE